jgi:capsular polysaccharide biosynthesis protein
MTEPRLLESALRRWPVVLAAFAVTTLLTIVWVAPKPATYESSGMYVVQPREGTSEDSARAMEALIRGTQINATNALIARSDEVQNAAESQLGSTSDDTNLEVEAEAITGANALTISARARDAKTAHALAVAAGQETMSYVDGLNQPYELVVLDPPALPTDPVNARKPLTIVLGSLLGLLLGLGLAAMIDRIMLLRRARGTGASRAFEPSAVERAPVERAIVEPPIATPVPASTAAASVDLVGDAISDPAVRRELDRAADGAATYSLGVVRLEGANGASDTPSDGDSHLRWHALATGETLRYLHDGLFAAVLPDTNAVKASKVLSDWLAEASDRDIDEPDGLLVSMTVVEYSGRQPALDGPEASAG